jgi:23S rRNA pseudouridine2604 synthase
MEKIRITKLLSERKVCSRREAEKFIDEGLILLNGTPVTEQGTRAYPSDRIEITETAKRTQAQKVTVMLHKPLGIVSNLPEPGYKEASSLITEENHWEGDRIPYSEPISPLNVVGRLDVNSKGLLLLTQDGRIAKQVIGPTSVVEKEYIVRIQDGIRDRQVAQLREGLYLDGKKLKKAVVERKDEQTLLITLVEGKKRQLRRMCENIGAEITSLKRVRIGNLQLGTLPSGQWRFVDPSEFL